MNRIAPASRSTQLAATVIAVLVTASQLGDIEALAQQRQVSVHAQVVQLDRVVVTGQRTTTQTAASRLVAACQPTERVAC